MLQKKPEWTFSPTQYLNSFVDYFQMSNMFTALKTKVNLYFYSFSQTKI